MPLSPEWFTGTLVVFAIFVAVSVGIAVYAFVEALSPDTDRTGYRFGPGLTLSRADNSVSLAALAPRTLLARFAADSGAPETTAPFRDGALVVGGRAALAPGEPGEVLMMGAGMPRWTVPASALAHSAQVVPLGVAGAVTLASGYCAGLASDPPAGSAQIYDYPVQFVHSETQWTACVLLTLVAASAGVSGAFTLDVQRFLPKRVVPVGASTGVIASCVALNQTAPAYLSVQLPAQSVATDVRVVLSGTAVAQGDILDLELYVTLPVAEQHKP